VTNLLHDLAFRLSESLGDAPVGIVRPDLHPIAARALGIDDGRLLDRDAINALLVGRRADGEKIAGKYYAQPRRLPTDPRTGEERLSVPNGSYDFCPTPDKSVSVAWGFANPVERQRSIPLTSNPLAMPSHTHRRAHRSGPDRGGLQGRRGTGSRRMAGTHPSHRPAHAVQHRRQRGEADAGWLLIPVLRGRLHPGFTLLLRERIPVLAPTFGGFARLSRRKFTRLSYPREWAADSAWRSARRARGRRLQ
jgi:hypothetical protein